MTIRYDWEPLAELLDDGAAALALRHWQEIALDQGDVPLEVDWDAVLAEEAAGVFRVFTARSDGDLVGYISCRVFRPSRYAGTVYVNDDVFWLDPTHRRGWTGYRLLSHFLAALPKPCKVQIKHKLTFEGGRVGKLLERLGLRPVEVVSVAFLRE